MENADLMKSEALAELNKDKEIKPVADETVKTFLEESERGVAATKNVTAHLRMVTREDDKNLFLRNSGRSSERRMGAPKLYWKTVNSRMCPQKIWRATIHLSHSPSLYEVCNIALQG